jgi:hypothetical protein
MKKWSSGQSFIEVVVAIGAMSLLLVALLATISLSIKNSRLAKDRTQAVSMANEGVELMRAYRDYSFNDFFSEARVSSYNLPYNWRVEDGLFEDCSSTLFEIRDIYRRCVKLTSVDFNSVDVEVLVEWQEGSLVKETMQNTRLSKWER